MGLSSRSLDLIIKTISRKLFENKDLMIRIKAAESLGKLGSEKAIIPLCQALDKEIDYEVICVIMDAIVQISKSAQTMSDAPKNQFIFNKEVKTSAVNVEGDQNITYNPTPKTPAETAKEIQDLLKQLKEGNPDLNEEKLLRLLFAKNPTLKARLLNGIKEGGSAVLSAFAPIVNIPVQTIKGILEE